MAFDARHWQREFRKTPAGKTHVRKMNLRAAHGITPADYDTLLEKQQGVCAACRQTETGCNQYGIVSLAVDHDHATGVRRGLLCMRCNRALGLLQDDATVIERLLAYRKGY